MPRPTGSSGEERVGYEEEGQVGEMPFFGLEEQRRIIVEGLLREEERQGLGRRDREHSEEQQEMESILVETKESGDKGQGGHINLTPFPERVRANLEYWRETLHASAEELELARHVSLKEVWRNGEEPAPCRYIPSKDDAVGNAKKLPHIRQLQGLGVCESCKEEDVVCILPVFIKDEGDGKERLLWDGTHVNEYTNDVTFKLETAQYLRGWIPLNCWTTHCDFEKAFYHLYLDPEDRVFFGFAFINEEGRLEIMRFISPPMGWMRTPFLFHKLMRPIVRYLRNLSILFSLYCDDGFHFALCTNCMRTGGQQGIECEQCKENAQAEGQVIKATLRLAGITGSEKKCKYTPTQVQEHIGLVWDMRLNEIYLTIRRMAKIRESIEIIKRGGWISSRY